MQFWLGFKLTNVGFLTFKNLLSAPQNNDEYIEPPILDNDVAHVTRPIVTSFLLQQTSTTWSNFTRADLSSVCPEILYLNLVTPVIF